MKHNQSNTNDLEMPAELKHALMQLCLEFGNEKDVLNVAIKAILQALKEQGFHIRSPQELFLLEEGCEFIAKWADIVGGMRLAKVFEILATIDERLPEGAFLTDLTKAEITKWSKTAEGINFDLNVSYAFVTEEETNQ